MLLNRREDRVSSPTEVRELTGVNCVSDGSVSLSVTVFGLVQVLVQSGIVVVLDWLVASREIPLYSFLRLIPLPGPRDARTTFALACFHVAFRGPQRTAGITIARLATHLVVALKIVIAFGALK